MPPDVHRPSDEDPLLRHVHPEDLPDAFWSLRQDDQGLRLRLYLISEAALGPHYPIVLWSIAFDMTPDGEAYAREVVDPHDDAAIEAMVVEARRRWAAYDLERQTGTSP